MNSLEIVNEMVDYWESAVNVACQSNAENGYYDELDIVEYQNRLKKYQQIKQDLEKYNKVMKLLNSLFEEIRLEQEDWEGMSIFYMEDIKFDTFEISNELFNKLDDLKILVGDSNVN